MVPNVKLIFQHLKVEIDFKFYEPLLIGGIFFKKINLDHEWLANIENLISVCFETKLQHMAIWGSQSKVLFHNRQNHCSHTTTAIWVSSLIPVLR